MGLTSAYLTSTKDLEDFFNAIVTAQAPEQFSISFLHKLDFKSSAHRLFIGMLKGLGFLDADGVPTQRYYAFLDQTQAKQILAESIRDAYSDLFSINKNANQLELEDVKNKLRTLTQGKKTDDVLSKMANTFVALVNLADWSTPIAPDNAPVREKSIETPLDEKKPSQTIPTNNPISKLSSLSLPSGLHYNIQIHLPESRDIAVYDAIFRALREHLF
jgi:hypothetical protein